MDSLPAELVVKILQKAHASTLHKIKYKNRRMSSIMKKYNRLYEASQYRISKDIGTVDFYKALSVIFDPYDKFSDEWQDVILNVKNKLAYVELVVIEERTISKSINLLLEIDNLPKLQKVEKLQINECEFAKNASIASFLQKFSVESLEIDSGFPESLEYLKNLWKEMINKNVTLKHTSITSASHFYLTKEFLPYITAKEVPSLQLAGFFSLAALEVILNAIQIAFIERRMITWSFTFTNLYFPGMYFARLRQFLENNKNMNIVTIERERQEKGKTQHNHRCYNERESIPGMEYDDYVNSQANNKPSNLEDLKYVSM